MVTFRFAANDQIEMYNQVCGIIEKASWNEVIKWVSLHFEMLLIWQSCSSHMIYQVATHGGPLVRVSMITGILWHPQVTVTPYTSFWSVVLACNHALTVELRGGPNFTTLSLAVECGRAISRRHLEAEWRAWKDFFLWMLSCPEWLNNSWWSLVH